MNSLKTIFLAVALMMPFCMVAMEDLSQSDEQDADHTEIVHLGEVQGINSVGIREPQFVRESDFDLTGERLAGIRGPREGATASSPWDVLRRGIQYLPEDVKLRALQHFEQIDHKGHATIDDAVALANHYRYGDAVEERIRASYALLDPYTQALFHASNQSAQRQSQHNTDKDQND